MHEPPDPMQLDDPAATVRAIAAQARRAETPCGAGRMVWRVFGSGPALVLLHGGSGSWTHWIRNIPALSRRRRLLVADLPGLGESDLPDQPYSAESLAAIVSTGIDRLLGDSERFDLLGFSFGGILGGHVALAQQGRVASVTIAGAPAFGMPSAGPINEVVPVPPGTPADRAAAINAHNLRLFMIADPRRVDPLAIAVHGENIRRARLRSRKIARTDTLARALRRVPCRLAGIFGALDLSAHPSVEAHRDLFRDIDPRAEFETLPGVGHWAAYEDWATFNTVLEAQLDRHAA